MLEEVDRAAGHRVKGKEGVILWGWKKMGNLGFVLHNKRYKGLCILHANLAPAAEPHVFTSSIRVNG